MMNAEAMKKRLGAMTSDERKAFLEAIAEDQANASPYDKPVDWPKTHAKTVGKETVEVPYTCIENTKALLNHYGITARYNEMSKEVEINIPGVGFHRDTQLNNKLVWIINEAHHKGLPKSELDDHIGLIGNENAYHPVRDWILSKSWDGIDRLPAFYATLVSDSAVKEMLMKKWGVMAVAAVFSPDGIRPQGALVVEGAQGRGKTTWLSTLVADPKWIGEGQSLDPHDKDSVLEVVSRWIVELGEIQATFSRSDIQSLKAFITKNEDRIRPPYAEKVNTYARRTVFFGTVDETNFLNDKNGTRRFWTISVKSVDIAHGIDCQQLWAQFYELYRSGEQWWLDPEQIDAINENNEQYMLIDPIEEKLANRVDPVQGIHHGEWMNATAVLQAIGVANPSKTDCNTAAKWLKRSQADYRKTWRQFKVHIREEGQTLEHRLERVKPAKPFRGDGLMV